MDSLKYSNFNPKKAQNSVIGYIIDLQDRIRSNNIEVVNDKGTVITGPFLAKLDDMLQGDLERTLFYAFESVESIDFTDEVEGYSHFPQTLPPNVLHYIIRRTNDKTEIGRCVIQQLNETSCAVLFIELKEKYNSKYSIYDVLRDCIFGELGISDFKLQEGFQGLQRRQV